MFKKNQIQKMINMYKMKMNNLKLILKNLLNVVILLKYVLIVMIIYYYMINYVY